MFDPSAPDGDYELDMSNPCVCVLRWTYRACDRRCRATPYSCITTHTSQHTRPLYTPHTSSCGSHLACTFHTRSHAPPLTDERRSYSAVVLEHICKHISSATGVFASKDPKLPGTLTPHFSHSVPALQSYSVRRWAASFTREITMNALGYAELDGRRWSCPAFNALKEGRASLPTTGILAFRC